MASITITIAPTATTSTTCSGPGQYKLPVKDGGAGSCWISNHLGEETDNVYGMIMDASRRRDHRL